ncbi:hypothetical protein MMC20_007360 [Loxospora ochrophaea]|nr:hypothetical protein [Loxospora ochrophaea]
MQLLSLSLSIVLLSLKIREARAQTGTTANISHVTSHTTRVSTIIANTTSLISQTLTSTSQGANFTTFSPALTFCPLEQTASNLISSGLVSGGGFNLTSFSTNGVHVSAPTALSFPVRPRQVPDPRYRFSNASAASNITSSCTILYSPIITTECQTTLTPLGGIPIPISACDQNITFSSDLGYKFMSGHIATLTSQYVADWRNVVGGVPDGPVEVDVYNSGSFYTRFYEVWDVRTVMTTATTTASININTTVPGVSLARLWHLDVIANKHGDIARQSHYRSLHHSKNLSQRTQTSHRFYYSHSDVDFRITFDKQADSVDIC